MNITQMIKNLKNIKKEFGDAELLFCDTSGVVHYDFILADWTDNDLPFKQLLIKGCHIIDKKRDMLEKKS